jgi:hypothetical protein
VDYLYTAFFYMSYNCPFPLLRRILFSIVFIVAIQYSGIAQDTLPSIEIAETSGANIISWISQYKGVHAIGVQRSSDSLYNFATIGYVKQPGLKENEYQDRNFQMGRNFYRLYIELQGGKLSYSRSTPVIDSLLKPGSVLPTAIISAPAPVEAKILPKKKIIPYAPSLFVYTNQDGNVNISISGTQNDHYSLKFFDTSGVNIFTIPYITENFLILDKSNFLHSGWFNFELYQNETLKQKWKLYIPDLAGKSRTN